MSAAMENQAMLSDDIVPIFNKMLSECTYDELLQLNVIYRNELDRLIYEKENIRKLAISVLENTNHISK